MKRVEAAPSVAATLLSAVTRMTLRRALNVMVAHPATVHWPWPYGVLDRLASFLPDGAQHEKIKLDFADADLVYAPGVPHTGRAILYMHGGGFLTCGSHTHMPLIVRLSKAAQAPVLSVNYRMLPNNLREGMSDCLEAYLWLRREYPAHKIVLAGDSAGGYMAMSVAIHLAGVETPGAMVLLSPLLELNTLGKKEHANAGRDAMFSGGAFDALLRLLRRANDGELFEPIEQLHTVYEGEDLPPTLIHVSGSEALLHDATKAADVMTDLGAEADVVIWPGQIHVFQFAAPVVPEAQRSINQLGKFIIEKTSENPAEKTDKYRTATVG